MAAASSATRGHNIFTSLWYSLFIYCFVLIDALLFAFVSSKLRMVTGVSVFYPQVTYNQESRHVVLGEVCRRPAGQSSAVPVVPHQRHYAGGGS